HALPTSTAGNDMTTYTATATTGQTFTFNSKAKTAPAFAIIATANPDALRAAARKQVADILANEAIDQVEQGVRITRVAKQLEAELDRPVALFSKHGTRAAAQKALDRARSYGNGHTYELVPVTAARPTHRAGAHRPGPAPERTP